MNTWTRMLSLVGGFALLATCLTLSCGGGEELSLQQYLQRVEAIMHDTNERSDALDQEYEPKREEASGDDELLAAYREFVENSVGIVSQGADKIRDLDPPAEAETAHKDLVDAYSDGLELLKDHRAKLGDIESWSDVEDLWGEIETESDEISERADEACFALQDLADENDIDVDLECEGPEEPSGAAEPTPSGKATSSPAPLDVEVLDYDTHQSEYGDLTFFGEVVNNGDQAVAFVQVILTLTDNAGNVVETQSGYVFGPTVLEPGAKAPFSISVYDPPAEWARETLQVTAEPRSDSTFGSTSEGLEVSGVTVNPAEFGGLIVRGRVTNTGSDDASFVEVVFVARNTDGSVSGVGFTYIDVDPLTPGTAAPFEINLLELAGLPQAYDVLAAGDRTP